MVKLMFQLPLMELAGHTVSVLVKDVVLVLIIASGILLKATISIMSISKATMRITDVEHLTAMVQLLGGVLSNIWATNTLFGQQSA
jgi:hypothetical protein